MRTLKNYEIWLIDHDGIPIQFLGQAPSYGLAQNKLEDLRLSMPRSTANLEIIKQ